MKSVLSVIMSCLLMRVSCSEIVAVEGCNQFTLGGCDPNVNELIDVYPLPNVEGAEGFCQEVCQIQEGCNFFSYDKVAETCTLFQYRYLDSCQVIAGPVAPLIDECAAEPADSCDSFFRENCNYTGKVLFNKDSVTDGHSCQDLLAVLGPIYKATYFSYDRDTRECLFYETADMDCDIVNGPVMPDVEGCFSPETTTPNTEA